MAFDEKECPGCGSTAVDRERYRKGDNEIPLQLSVCRYCGTKKCCMCDMGDDVRCISCERESGDAPT